MIELLLEACLADRPAVCATRLVPGPGACAVARADAWAAARPDLVVAAARCAEPSAAAAPLDVAEIAPGVFVHRGRVALPDAGNAGDTANIGFVVGRDAVAVIDAGGSRAVGEGLYRAIRDRTDLPIRWLILTHMHPDHVFGAAVFREAGATIVAHPRLAAALAERADSYRATLVRELGAAAALGSEIVLPDRAATPGQRIDLGGRMLELELHPTAHTDNDLTVFDAATGTWWMGDLVFARHLPVVDGAVLGWLELLDRLAPRPAARIVPGHGPPALPWPGGAAPMRGYLEALVTETRAALARGESLGEAAPRLGIGLRGDWALFEDYNGRNATAVYRELEWE